MQGFHVRTSVGNHRVPLELWDPKFTPSLLLPGRNRGQPEPAPGGRPGSGSGGDGRSLRRQGCAGGGREGSWVVKGTTTGNHEGFAVGGHSVPLVSQQMWRPVQAPNAGPSGPSERGCLFCSRRGQSCSVRPVRPGSGWSTARLSRGGQHALC